MKNIPNGAVLVQIGTNDGNDEFRELVRNTSPSKLILVEPIKMFNESILYNYKGIQNVILENVAITNKKQGEVSLVIPKERREMWGTGNYTLLPMDDWGSEFEEHKVPSMTFQQLCDKHNITHIDFLQIDTEGYDHEIIKSIDFNKITIDCIRYEKFDFPIEVYSRHGEKAKQYGVAGAKHSAELLTALGYSLEEDTTDVVARKV
jgi:FkbM family methyltransferase